MVDLSHWDFALDFNGFEAAALILGLDPEGEDENRERIKPVFERVERSYKSLRSWHETDITPSDTGKLGHLARPNDGLESVDMAEYHKTTVPDHIYVGGPALFLSWLLDTTDRSKFSKQRFTREEISRWLLACKLHSIYPFLKAQAVDTRDLITDANLAHMPLELHSANLAFDAVMQGYRSEIPSFKQRIEAWLKQYRPALVPAAVERISTVANNDKTTGRKRSKSDLNG
jgi:hypothetical protein